MVEGDDGEMLGIYGFVLWFGKCSGGRWVVDVLLGVGKELLLMVLMLIVLLIGFELGE